MHLFVICDHALVIRFVIGLQVNIKVTPQEIFQAMVLVFNNVKSVQLIISDQYAFQPIVIDRHFPESSQHTWPYIRIVVSLIGTLAHGDQEVR